jgi:hypothetical protein
MARLRASSFIMDKVMQAVSRRTCEKLLRIALG